MRLVAFMQPDRYGLVDSGPGPVIYGLLLTATGPGPGFPIRKAKNRTGPDLKTLDGEVGASFEIGDSAA